MTNLTLEQMLQAVQEADSRGAPGLTSTRSMRPCASPLDQLAFPAQQIRLRWSISLVRLVNLCSDVRPHQQLASVLFAGAGFCIIGRRMIGNVSEHLYTPLAFCEEPFMRNSVPIVLVSMVVLLGCAKGTPNKLVLAEGGTTSDGFSVSHGGVVIIDDEPGLAFATLSPKTSTKRIVYFLVFNHGTPTASVTTASSNDGRTAKTMLAIRTYGNVCTVKYDAVVNQETKGVEKETIYCGDDVFEPASGRVLLIDMKRDPPVITQLELELTTDVPDFKRTDTSTDFAKATLRKLRSSSQPVDEFCRSIELKAE